MNKKILIFLIIISAVSTQTFSSIAKQSQTDTKIIAYYFHGNFRCYTCKNMENYSKELIQSKVKNYFKSVKFEFKAVNVENKENEHFIKDYKLYTKSLILSLVKKGKEIKSKNLTKIWLYAGNKQKFFNYATNEIKDFIKDIK